MAKEPQPYYLRSHCISDMAFSWTFGPRGSDYHRHMDFYEFCLVVGGTYTHIYENVTTELKLGDFLFFRPGEAHTLTENSADCFHYSIIIQDSYFQDYVTRHMDNAEHIFSTPYMQKTLSGSEFSFMTYLTSAVARDVSTYHIPYVNHFLYNALFVLFQPISDSHDNSIQISAVDLRKRFDSFQILDYNVQTIYTDYPVSRTKLIHDFKELTGYTIVQYRNMKRIEYAAHLLQEENYPITVVANLVHMPSLGYFSSQFQKEYGMTPKQYQLTHRKSSDN